MPVGALSPRRTVFHTHSRRPHTHPVRTDPAAIAKPPGSRETHTSRYAEAGASRRHTRAPESASTCPHTRRGKEKSPGHRQGDLDSPEPPRGVEPLTYALRGPARSCGVMICDHVRSGFPWSVACQSRWRDAQSSGCHPVRSRIAHAIPPCTRGQEPALSRACISATRRRVNPAEVVIKFIPRATHSATGQRATPRPTLLTGMRLRRHVLITAGKALTA